MVHGCMVVCILPGLVKLDLGVGGGLLVLGGGRYLVCYHFPISHHDLYFRKLGLGPSAETRALKLKKKSAKKVFFLGNLT